MYLFFDHSIVIEPLSYDDDVVVVIHRCCCRSRCLKISEATKTRLFNVSLMKIFQASA